MNNILVLIEVFLGVVVIVSVLSQKSTSDALSGLIQNSSKDSFFSKNKAKTKDIILQRLTFLSISLFALNTIIMNLI